MKSVTVAVEVPQRREEVFDFLNVLGNHESFTDHFLLDWEVSGPRAGVGARARMRVIDMEVVAADPPRMTAEESIGAREAAGARGASIASMSCRPAAPRSASSSRGWRRRPSSAWPRR
jgi:hypothetical protein